MHTRSLLRRLLVCTLSLCLSGWSLLASAVADIIVVTTNQDVVDPPFNTGGLCGNGTVANLPGADGHVSLREAIIAANNTPGQKTITFAPNLSGATITLTGALALCGGHTTLTGDIDGDNTPDITLDGSAVVDPLDVIEIFSSHNTVQGLRILGPGDVYVAGIAIDPQQELALATVVDNTLTHNIILRGHIEVHSGIDRFGQFFNGGTSKHTIVQENTILNSVYFGVWVDEPADHGEITDLTIAGNTISGGVMGIAAFAGGEANYNHLDVTIKDNTITDNTDPGDTGGIYVGGGFASASHNQVRAQILHNTISNNIGNGINVASGLDNSSDNTLAVTIRDNTLENNTEGGMLIYSGFGALFFPSGDSLRNSLDARIEHNTVKNSSLFGLWLNGGIGSYNGVGVANANGLKAVVTDNTITEIAGEGIHVDAGGSGAANDNEVNITVGKNTVCGSTMADIHAIGGLLGNPFRIDTTGTGNVLEGEITKNTASTVVVENGVAGNTAQVTQSNNTPCP